MPSGACVIRYEGKRGVVFRVQYRDADGRQVKETLGPERDKTGRLQWTQQKAERELGKRLAAVDEGMRKPRRRKFETLCDEFEDVSLSAKPRKRSTVIDYKATIRNHLRPAFAAEDLVKLSQRPEAFERYAADKLKAGLSPKTVRNHLALLGLMFKQARRWRWVSENPLDLVEPPPLPDVETETLSAAEVARLLTAYSELSAASEKEERFWIDGARRMTVVALSTGLRRGELLGLRWEDIDLLERRLHVRQAFVRGEMTTPKSKAGRRVIQLGPRAVEALEEQFKASNYTTGDSIVFCHEALGTPLDPSKLSGYARKALERAAIGKPFRPWHGCRHTCLTETAAAGVPADVRAGEGWSRAGFDDGALPARGEDGLSRRGRTRRGALVR